MYFLKWVKRYGLFWSIRYFMSIRTSYNILSEIASTWGVKEDWEKFLTNTNLRTNFKYIAEVCSARINERGINYVSAIKKITK